jgi:hypothetical protein
MEEEDVSNDSWLDTLCGTSTETIEATIISGDDREKKERGGSSYTQAPMKLP